MNILNTIIEQLSVEEVRYYKISLQRYTQTSLRKDEKLFDYIRDKKQKYDESKIYKKLYPNIDKNNFYRLKNRLLENVLEEMAHMHQNKNKNYKVHQLLVLNNLFYQRHQYPICYYLLQRCERVAAENEYIELLDIIYAEFIRLSLNYIDVNPEIYIKKQTANLTQLNAIREIDQVIAAVHFRILKSQNYGKRDNNLLRLLDNTIEEYSLQNKLQKSKVFQVRMFRAISQKLIQKKEYQGLYDYCIRTYKLFISKKWFDKETHEIQLQLMVYFTNSLFRLERYDESLLYAQKMKDILELYQKQHYDKYFVFYYNALIINYSELDVKKALLSLEDMNRHLQKAKITYYEQFVLLNRALFLYKLDRYNEAISNIVKFYISNHYKKADEAYRFKIVVAELMIQYKTKDIDTLKIRLEQVRVEFKKHIFSYKTSLDVMMYDFIIELSKTAKKLSYIRAKELSLKIIKDEKNAKDMNSSIIGYSGFIQNIKEIK